MSKESVEHGDPSAALESLVNAVDALAASEPTRVDPAALGDLLVRLEHHTDRLCGVSADWLRVFEEAHGYEEFGAPTLAGFARQQLRVTPAEARRRVRAGQALRDLPLTRAALAAGTIGARHVDAIAVGHRQMGPAVMSEVEALLVDVAANCDADEVKAAVVKVRERLDPDAADAAYVHALERRDVTVSPVGEGFALSGFLDPETGTLFREVLYSGSKPLPDDDRTAGQRRVDALREICTAIADHGLPSDRGLRPHLFVTVTAEANQHARPRVPSAARPIAAS